MSQFMPSWEDASEEEFWDMMERMRRQADPTSMEPVAKAQLEIAEAKASSVEALAKRLAEGVHDLVHRTLGAKGNSQYWLGRASAFHDLARLILHASQRIDGDAQAKGNDLMDLRRDPKLHAQASHRVSDLLGVLRGGHPRVADELRNAIGAVLDKRKRPN